MNVFSYDFLDNISLSLAYFYKNTVYNIYITYKICVNQLFILSVSLLVNSSLLAFKFLGNQRFFVWIYDYVWGSSAPNACVVNCTDKCNVRSGILLMRNKIAISAARLYSLAS